MGGETANQNLTQLDWDSRAVAGLVRLYPGGFPDWTGSSQHDFIVSNVSAFGGLPTSAQSQVSWMLDTPTVATSGVHHLMGRENYIGNSVVRPLLDAPVGSAAFASGMPANANVPVPTRCQSRDLPTLEMAENGSVVIDEPTSGTVLAAGDTVQVLVQATGTFEPTAVFVTGVLGTVIGDSTPMTAELTIPADAFGLYDIEVFAIDAMSRVAFAVPVSVQVSSAASLLSIEVLTPWASLGEEEDQLQLSVRGHFDGPVTRDLTNAASGTEYESSNPSVATVSPDGLVARQGAGQALIVIRNGGFEIVADVVVTSVPCRADFNGDGARGVPDIFAFLAAWFAQDPPSDWDYDGTVAVPDIFAFLSAWFAGCP